MSFATRATTIQKAHSSQGSNKTPWKLIFDKGYAYNIGILSKYVLPLQIHRQSAGPALLCDKMYFDDQSEAVCEECEKPGYQGKGKNTPTFVYVMAGWVFDLVGKKRGETDFNENPEKILEVSGGKGQINFNNFNLAMAADPPYLSFNPNMPLNSIWRLLRLEEGGMAEPCLAPMQEVQRAKLKFDSLKPELLDKYDSMSIEETFGLYCSGYGNVNRKYLEEREGFVFPQEEESASTPAAVDAKSKGKKGKDVDLSKDLP